MLRQPTYLTLKRAAQLLGVHEQTLRSWERQGLIRMAHLPKSGYRRVPAAEVERLQEAMLAEQPALAVRLAPPQKDAESLQRAEALADAVRVDLAGLEANSSLDEFMVGRRGRTWSP